MHIRLQVTPAARRDAVKRVTSEHYKINVREKAEGNLANRRALSMLAQELNVPTRNLRIMSGHKQPHKIVFVRHGLE